MPLTGWVSWRCTTRRGGMAGGVPCSSCCRLEQQSARETGLAAPRSGSQLASIASTICDSCWRQGHQCVRQMRRVARPFTWPPSRQVHACSTAAWAGPDHCLSWPVTLCCP
jgi:hypothetical protein